MANLENEASLPMNKKICMVGSSAVGKTSLVARFVRSIFSEKYLTTVGVKIDKKIVLVEGREVGLVLWDLNGDDEFQKLQMTYLRGAAGYFLVVDGCRRPTLETALDLQERVTDALGQTPFVLAVNKADLREDWEVEAETLAQLRAHGWHIWETSAKTGQGVEEAFQQLAALMLA
jgi:hypothetical protein